MIFIAFFACNSDTTWLDGTWRLSRWTSRVESLSGTTVAEFELEDAGHFRFEGDGEMWTSVMYADMPYVDLDANSNLTTKRKVTWAYWALVNEQVSFDIDDVQFAWGQNYAGGDMLKVMDRDLDAGRWEAESQNPLTLWPVFDGDEYLTWTFTRDESL